MSEYEYVRNCIATYFERLQMQGPSSWSNYAVTWGAGGLDNGMDAVLRSVSWKDHWNLNCTVVNSKEIESFNLKVQVYRNPSMYLSNGEFIWPLYGQVLDILWDCVTNMSHDVYLAVT